jgi:hypothetical protein
MARSPTRPNLKMDHSHENDRGIFALSKQPFRMLRFDPTSKHFADAASAEVMVYEREIVLDPKRQLACELRCPIDCPLSDLEPLYAALSNATGPIGELHLFADRLWPLTRANFVAHIASRRPANAAWLYALLESHAAIDTNAIYLNLKAARTAAHIPAPSWISLNEGLDELLNIHCSAAFVGYDVIESAVEPVLECARQILADGERHLVESLGSLLRSYRQFSDPLRKEATQQIAIACLALRQQPDDATVETLANAVQVWMSTTRPLLMWRAYQGRRELDFDTPVDELRALIANLSENEHYDVAIKITEIARDLFSAVPTTIDQLVEDAHLIEELSSHGNIRQLQDTIDELESEPGPLIAALEQDGFGQASSGPAKILWEAFLRAAGTANEQSTEAAWWLVREFAIRLSNRPEAAAAVLFFIAGMIEYGERASVAPQFLKALRDNLGFMQSFIASEPIETVNSGQTSRLRSVAAKLFQRRVQPSNSEDSFRKRNRRIGSAILAAFVIAACGAALYFDFDQVRLLWPKVFASAPTQPAMLTSIGEAMPAIGTGQHLAIDGVRYCHFQEERLRIIKQELQGPQDTRAYNLMIVDYNSRCSDYFFQDNDLKAVLAEVNSKRKFLESEARQIMSAWPGHAGSKDSAEGAR